MMTGRDDCEVNWMIGQVANPSQALEIAGQRNRLHAMLIGHVTMIEEGTL